MSETSSQPAAALDGHRPNRRGPDGAAADHDQLADFEEAFRLAKHALGHASIGVFARHGVYEGQQFVLRLLWREDGLTPRQRAPQLRPAPPTLTRAGTPIAAAG